MWGLFACVVAMYSANQGSLVEVVNRFDRSFTPAPRCLHPAILTRSTARAPWGRLPGCCGADAFCPDIAFLWHNLIGAVVVSRQTTPDVAGLSLARSAASE